jgi:molecular chaperone GrpE
MTDRKGPIAALNSIDLAVEFQRLDAEREEFVEKLLPLLDNVERLCRGLESAESEAVAQRKEALGLLADLADRLLEEIGLERLGAMGEISRPGLHDVVDTEVCSDQPQGLILYVIQFGWMFRGKLLRPAKVVAAARA